MYDSPGVLPVNIIITEIKFLFLIIISVDKVFMQGNS